MDHCFIKKQRTPLFRITFLFALVLLGTLCAYGQATVDCSINTNCGNAYCNYAANIERGCNCFDNIDNDGDGKIDKADSNCATYYGLSFVGEGSNCSITPPGTTDPFDLVNAPITSAQNTADTQSKVSVGDVDGDGIPDAVITSKWNSEIRVVATRAPQADGTQAGAVKSDFNLSGAAANTMFSDAPNSGDCKPNRLLFEHENLIADIDKDGKAELFGVVSNRGGNPQTPPTCFYLVGFKYAPSDLVALFKAVPIGTDRPGTFGIADMDGDGKAEIYLRDRIYAAETGKLLAQAGGNWDLDVTSAPVAVNISGTNTMELVCGTKIYSIPNLSDRNPVTPGSLTLLHDMNTIGANDCYVKLMNDPVEYGIDTHSSCSVADIDKDGNVDVVISGALNSVSGPTAVFYWNVVKNQVNYFLPTDASDVNGWAWGTGRVNIGDADGDGNLDLSFISGSRLWCLKVDMTTGALSSLWASFRTINDSRSGVLTVTIYDFDNDGNPEMVYRDSQILAVIDASTGTTLEWSAVCQSHTYTEGPIIADVNGDGGTDICVACNTSNSFDINDGLQQQALGQFRLYYSSANDWLPTRKVWNQPGYFVVNIKDNLQLPFPQLDQNVIFGTGACPNGIPGPQMPMNVFLNQVPFLSSTGCPVFPAPDLSYVGDNPDNPGVDSNGDGLYTPTVEVIPPICGDLGIQVRFNIINDGDLPITGNIPVSFFKADPTVAGVTAADLLYTTNINIVNLQVDQTLTTPFVTFNGTGGTFRLYIVLNNNGSVLPINLSGSSTTECRIDNNLYSVNITPDPFTTKIEKIKDNFKCSNAAPDNGEVRVRIFKGAVEQMDYSPYGFQWYTGTAASPTPIAGATNYILTGLAEGDYTALVTNTVKGCVGVFVDTTIVRLGNDPVVTITKISDQTKCNPPDGALQASIAGGNAGFTFDWLDIALTPLGISGPDANNLKAGNYVLKVSKDGCDKNVTAPIIQDPQIPDATASVLQHVIDCVNPNSGSVTASAVLNTIPQDPANYTFEWYFYNISTNTTGSILPVTYGTGVTRTGLPVGGYQVVVTDNNTQCESLQKPIVEVTSQTVLPTASISEVSPQTSCDPAQPNGVLTASAVATGFVSPNDFTFEWFLGDNTLPANKVTTTSGAKGETVNQVQGGGVFYTVKVTTPNNCSDTEKYIITQNVNVPVVALDSINNSICNPALAASTYNGSVTSAVSFAGNPVADFTNYQFTWHNGPLDTDPVIGGNTSSITGLNGGFYTLIAERTDLHCKSLPVSIEVLNATVLPVIKTDSIASTNCVVTYNGNTIANGQASVATIDGAAPAANYTFLWSDNGSPTDADGRTTSSINTIQGGYIYTVQVTNTLTGCQNTDNVALPDASVVPVVSLVVDQPNTICDPALTVPAVQFNGRVQANFTTLSGNATDYKYSWRNVTDNIGLGDTPPNNTGPGVTLVNEFGGLNGNKDYNVIAENTVLGCTSGAAQVYLPNVLALPVIKTDSIASTNCVLNYNGNMIANGQAFVLSVDGAAPTANHAFLWSDNASTTDADGRTTATITQIQGGFIYTVQVTNLLTGCRNTDPVPLADASVIPVMSLAVDQPNTICDPTLTVPAVQFNGRVEASFTTLSGNIADYKYTWRNVTDNAALGDTPPNNTGPGVTLVTEFGGLNGNKDYSVIAENTLLGCTSGAAQVFLPNVLALPVIKTDSIASTNCVLNYNGNMIANGQAFVLSVDGAAPNANHAFLWSDNASTTDADGRTTSTITQIQGGFIYTVQVTNLLTGCRNTDPVPLSDASVIPVVSLAVDQPNTICDPALTVPAVQFNGRVETSFITLSGNIANYKYTWRNVTDNTALGDTPPNSTGPGVTLVTEFGGLNGNKDYSVVAENTVLGCTSGAAQVFLPNSLQLPVIKTDSIPSTNCVPVYLGNPKSNGQVSLTSVDGAAPNGATQSFLWSDDGLTPTPTASTATSVINLEGGFQYSVTVTNRLTGCVNNHTIALPDNQIKPVIDVAKTSDNVNCDEATFGSTGALEAIVFYDGIQKNDPGVIALPANYEITWSTATTGDVLNARPAGSYSATVVDTDLGCTSDPDADVVIDAFAIPAITIDPPTPQTSCDAGAPNGGLQATITTTTSTLRYQWYEGIGTGGLTIGGLVTGQASGTVTPITNKASNDYTIFIRNESTGCEAIRSAFIPDNITYPGVSFTNVNPVTICSPTPNGAAEPVLTNLSALPGNNFDLFYVYTFTGGTYPTDPLVIKASADAKNVINGVGPLVAGVNPPVYNDMAPGYLTALVVDRNTKCESNPETVQIIDNTVDNTITINGTTAAGFCGGVGGAIDVTVGGGVAPQNYIWYQGTPANIPANGNINFFNNPPDMTAAVAVAGASGVVNGAGEDLGPPSMPVAGVGSGTYTVVITDANGCGAYFVESVPFTAAPAITVTETDVTKCVAPFDGEIEVDVVGGSAFGYTVEIFSGNGPTGTALLPNSGIQPSPINFGKTALEDGQYYVQVTDQDPVNLPCPLGSVHQLDPLVFNPIIALNQIIENTSCDPVNSADGKVELTATADAQQNTVLNPTDFRISAIAPAPVGLAIPRDIPDNATSSGVMNGFGPGPYTITVTDNNSGCASDAVVNIPDQPVLPTIFTVASLDDSYCAPTSNGRIQVTSVGVGVPEPVANYEFEWYIDPNVAIAANLVYKDPGGGATTGELFDATKTGLWSAGVTPGWSFGATPGEGNGNRTYYVRGRRTTGSGVGCYTQFEQKDVLDVHKTPDITLTTFFNTSCIPAAGEGVVRAVTDIANDPRDGNVQATGTYTYTWNPDPAAGNTSGGGGVANGAGIARLADFDITALTDNTYTVTSINSINGCAVSSTAVISTNPLPITLLSFTKQDQLICNPDGNITVTEVEIDASNSANPTVYSFVPSANPLINLTDNFNFAWYDANNDADNNAATFNNTIELQSGGVDINDDVLTEDGALTTQPFATMDEGTYYVIATRKPGMTPGAGCTTVPVKVDIIKDINNPVITSLEAFANTSCISSIVEGRIELTVNTTSTVPAESTSTYTYSWVEANPNPLTNPFGNGTNAGAASSVTIPPGYAAPPALPSDALKDDTYTITVRNDYSNCTVTGQVVITPQKYPITLISFTQQDQLICDADGRITVTQVTIDGSTSNLPVYNFATAGTLTTNFDFQWFDSNNDNDNNANTFSSATPLRDALNAPITDVVLSEDPAETTQPFAAMGAGSYYVVATRKPLMVPGAGCSTQPVRVNIEDKHINPQITALEAFANTSCDANVVEGRIEMAVNTVSGVPAESGSTYTYNWAAANPNPLTNPFGTGTNAGAANAVTIPPGYAAPPALPSDALKDDTYTITVTNDYSNCQVTGQVVITPQKYPVTLISFTKQDQLICDPDGRITVTQVTIDGSTSNLPVYNFATAGALTTNFDFEWFDSNNDGDNNDNTFSTAIPLNDALNNPITDVVLSEDPAETTQPFTTMGAGSYYVLATRKPGMTPGAGCSTLPIRVNIEDKHINPQITALEAFANTSCDAGIVEGRIELTVNTTSGVPAESGSTYSYTWVQGDVLGNPGGGGNAANVANATATSLMTIPPGYQVPPLAGPALKDDSYTITVRNDYSNCTVTGQAIITPQKYPITLISFTNQDQMICYPDGNITVTQVTIDGSTSNLGVFNFNTPAGLTSNFDFSWFAANNDGDNNPNTFNNTIPINDGTNPIIDPVLSEDATITSQPFANMAAGTYYVLATRKTGMAPGAGCSTEPVRVDIKDLHVNPVVSFVYQPNSSCDPVNPNGVVIATASEANGNIIDTYSFVWTLNGGPLAGATVPSNPDNHTGRLDDAADGNYIVTITNTSNTGCDITGSLEVLKDLNISKPNIIDVSTIDPTDCLPSASAEVTRISIGGLTFYNTPPDNLDTSFDYEWYKGDFAPGNIMAGEVNHNLINITPDKYYVLVQDMTTACKSSPKEVVINDDDIVYPVVTITQTQLQISCPSSNGTGVLEALGDGQSDANPNYSFVWFNNLTTTAPSFAATSTVGNLISGDYSVQVTNAVTGCSASGLYIIPNEAADFYPVLSLTTQPRVNCLVFDGSLLAREVGYDPSTGYPFAPNYSTEIYPGSNADISQPGTPMPNVPGFALNWTIGGLDIGIYTVKITDNNTGCVTTDEHEVLDGRTPPVVEIVQDHPLTYCDPTPPNGQLSATADNGLVGGYTFEWYRGATVTGNILQTNNKLIGETTGDFTVRVTNDITGCFADGTDRITPDLVFPPAPDAVVVQHRTHCKTPDGWVSASVGGITLNFSFNWYDGASVQAPADFNGVDYTKRDVGPYTVTATDVVTGCISQPTTVEVEDKTEIPALIFKTQPSFCEDVPSELNRGTGMIELQLEPAYLQSDSIVWYNSAGAPAGEGSYITGLYPGDYDVFLETIKGCEANGSATVGTEILAYNLVTRNGDQKNDLFVVDCISRFPGNNVKIFNRAGVLVYEANGYNNNDVVFQGLGERGVYAAGNELPVGTYFYVIDKRDGTKPKTGYLELVK